jgi:hypothetical protein
MTKAEYRWHCLFRSPVFREQLRALSKLDGQKFDGKRREILTRFGVDALPVVAGRRQLHRFVDRLCRPTQLRAPGVLWSYRGSLIQARMVEPERDDRVRMFDHAKLWIPIYDDTTAEDLDWDGINRARAQLYGRPRRAQHDQFAKRLVAWDRLRDGLPGGMKALADRLRVSPSQGRAILATAWKDIMGGTAFPGIDRALRRVSRRQRSLTEDFHLHLAGCPVCSSGSSGALCQAGDRILNLEQGVRDSDPKKSRLTPNAAEEAAERARRGRSGPRAHAK